MRERRAIQRWVVLFTTLVLTLSVLSLSPMRVGPAPAGATDCSSGWVALTYDDGPIKVRTDTVLAALDTAGVQATFFVVGVFARANPDLLRDTADRGHVVGNHTDQHENLTGLSEIAIVKTLDKTDAAIRAAGVEPGRIVRPPGGNMNQRVEDVIETAGYIPIMWDVDPQDWSGISAGGIHSNVVSHATNGSIILLHDANAHYRNTATATKSIVSTLHSRGFCFGVINNSGEIVPADEAAQLIGPFYDIASSVFTDDILWLFEEGITKGCNPPYNNRYCPDISVTRGQMAAFLVRTLGLTDGAGSDRFTDDDGSIFEADIERLAAAGITKGCNPPENTKFCPDRKVSREVMAAFLVRAFDLPDTDTPSALADIGDSMFSSEIASLAAAGVTKGCNPPENTLFCPRKNVTRGQMAAFLHRASSSMN